MTWYRIPTKDNEHGKEPDFGAFTPTDQWYACQIGDEFYLLTEETMPFPELSDAEVTAAGLDPNRSVTGA